MADALFIKSILAAQVVWIPHQVRNDIPFGNGLRSPLAMLVDLAGMAHQMGQSEL